MTRRKKPENETTKENAANTSNDNLMDDINENKPNKHVLLAKYLDKSVNAFWQYDCFTNETDSLLDPDGDNDALCGGDITYELMSGASVRVLIRPDESKQDVIRALLKIVEEIHLSTDFKYKTAFVDREDVPF